MGGTEFVYDWLRGWAQLTMLGYIGLIGLTIYLITITMRLFKNKKQNTFVELERKEILKQIDIAERDSIEWEINKKSGLGKFLLREGFYRWGLPMGVSFGIMLQIIENGFTFRHFNFISNLFFGLVVFSITGLLSALISWKRKEKKYS